MEAQEVGMADAEGADDTKVLESKLECPLLLVIPVSL